MPVLGQEFAYFFLKQYTLVVLFPFFLICIFLDKIVLFLCIFVYFACLVQISWKNVLKERADRALKEGKLLWIRPCFYCDVKQMLN